MTKWIKFGVLLNTLILSNSFVEPGWGQTRPSLPTGASIQKEGTALVAGKIVDAETKQPIAGASIKARSQSGTMRAQQAVTTNGSYELSLDPKQPYIFTYEAPGYETLEEQFVTTVSQVSSIAVNRRPTLLYRTGKKPAAPTTATTTALATTLTAPAPALVPATTTAQSATSAQGASGAKLAPPKTLDAKVVYAPPLIIAAPGKITQLRAIQFVQSKAELLPDAQPALEQLLAFMRDKPATEIMLAGHTDNQGDFDQNVLLSKQRVDLVKEYLVKNGIAASRITTRGYGPTRPIANNNAEVSRQQNRRVEMIVVKE